MAKKLQFFVAGLGRFGISVAVTLEKMGYDVMAMDIDEEVVQDLSDTLGYVVCADCSDEKNLVAIGAGNADIAVVSVGDLSASLMTTLLLKEMGVKKIVVKALDPIHGKMLQKIGADKIIYSEKEMGVRVAHNLISPGSEEGQYHRQCKNVRCFHQTFRIDPFMEDDHIFSPADPRPEREQKKSDGGRADATCGRDRRRSDEHEEHDDKPGRIVHGVDIKESEACHARRDRHEEGTLPLFSRRSRRMSMCWAAQCTTAVLAGMRNPSGSCSQRLRRIS